MILLRVGTDIVTYKGDQFQIIPTLQDPITQAEFEEHGIDPDILNTITQEKWEVFKQDFNASAFTVIVFTTYEEEPKFNVQIASHLDLPLEFSGVAANGFPLDFMGTLKDNFPIDYTGLATTNLPLAYSAQQGGLSELKLLFESYVEEQGYIVFRANESLYSLKDNTVNLVPGTNETFTFEEFKQYGMTPDDVKDVTQDTWRDFTVGHNAMNFKVVVFTTFEEEPELKLTQVELKPMPVFEAILPTNVWLDGNIEFHIDADTNVPGYPVGSVYYEIYKESNILDNLIKQGMTPDVFVTTIEEDTDFILNIGDGYETFTVKYEDKDTLIVTRSFPFEGAEWELDGLVITSDSLVLGDKATSGTAKTSSSQIVTLGRKTISSVAVSGSTDVVEEVLVGEPMRLIGENLYEIEIPKGKQLLIEVVEQ